MKPKQPYSITLDQQYGFLEVIDLQKISDECQLQWFNQTLCRVNDCVVRLGILQGEFHWHQHSEEDEFFYVISGKLFVDLEDQTIELEPQQGFCVPRQIIHRTRAPERTVVMMIEGNQVKPTGD